MGVTELQPSGLPDNPALRDWRAIHASFSGDLTCGAQHSPGRKQPPKSSALAASAACRLKSNIII